MSEYIIMTDSCCDLSDEMAKELELNVVPLTVHLEGKDYPNYLDGSAISNAEFYGAIRAGKVASTSAANVGQFQDAMRAVLDTMKNMQTLDRQVTIRSAMNAKNREEIEELAKKLVM